MGIFMVWSFWASEYPGFGEKLLSETEYLSMNERSGRCCALIHGMFVCHRVVKGTSEAESFTYGVTDSVAPSFSIGFRRTLSTSKNRIWEEGEVAQEKITLFERL